MEIALDRAGNPDPQAWLDDPEPWHAWLEGPDIVDRQGDVQHEDEYGWHIRMPPKGRDLDDTSSWSVSFPNGPSRPGETVTTRGPDGEDWAWRIVSVDAQADMLTARAG